MNNVIAMTIIQCAPNLASKLAGHLLFQAPVFDNIVEHIILNVFEDQIVVILVNEVLSHTAYVWMV